MDRLIGIHAVAAALEAGRPLDRLLVLKGTGGPRLQEIIDTARKLRTPIRFETREALDREARGGVHQGVIAIGSERGFADLGHAIANAPKNSIFVVTDGVEDPHNLGAIVRSAHAAGAFALIIPERRSVGLTEVVSKAAAGALEYLPIVRVKNVNRALEQLKKAGYWTFGLDERGAKTIYEVDFAGKVALVLGGEGSGLHRLTAETCDGLVRIPMAGKIASLNVSVAAGVALFEVVRQRR